jgi:chromosome segregation ATPase
MSDSTERLNKISAELASILEARVQELATSMRDAERVTRQIISTEVEIARARSTKETLGTESDGLDKELAALRKEADVVRGRHGALVEERNRLRDTVAQRERDVRDAESEVQSARKRLGSLDEEAEALRRETADLRTKLGALEENVTRMRKLKEELMQGISGLSQQMAALNLPQKE